MRHKKQNGLSQVMVGKDPRQAVTLNCCAVCLTAETGVKSWMHWIHNLIHFAKSLGENPQVLATESLERPCLIRKSVSEVWLRVFSRSENPCTCQITNEWGGGFGGHLANSVHSGLLGSTIHAEVI